MIILAIDPGPTESAYVITDGELVFDYGKCANDMVANMIRFDDWPCELDPAQPLWMVIEQIRSYGMAVGAEVFDTCVWSGRFAEAYNAKHGIDPDWLPRKDIKLNLCGNPRAKDANIRQAIIDRFGGKETAIGRKAAPGPLYGISADVWAALAVGLTWLDLRKAGRI